MCGVTQESGQPPPKALCAKDGAPLRVLLCVQAFPPLAKQAGGVAKDYFALCRALIDGLGCTVTLMTPVNIAASGEADVDRWLASGLLEHAPVGGVLAATSRDGIATMLDLPSAGNIAALARALGRGRFDLCIMDDVLFRAAALLLARGLGVPSIASTHTDVPGMEVYRRMHSVRVAWGLHLASAFCATVHATCSEVFAETLRARYWVPVHAVWPPVLWSQEFLRPPEDFAERAAKERSRWLAYLGFEPRAILLFAGRWSSEKRIHLLFQAVPADCALVVVGDSDTDYADEVEAARSRSVLPLRRMLSAEELRVAYAACDLFVSASCFETLGNVVVEAWASGLPVAVQPAQGHLEFVVDGENSYFVDFDDAEGARARLQEIVAAGPDSPVRAAVRQAGARMREQDFPAQVEASLLRPALAAAELWGHRRLWDLAVRLWCFLAFAVLWIGVALGTRLLFAASSDPRFSYIPPGSAVETARGDGRPSCHQSGERRNGYRKPDERKNGQQFRGKPGRNGYHQIGEPSPV